MIEPRNARNTRKNDGVMGCVGLGGKRGGRYAESVAVRYENKFTLIGDIVFGGLILWVILHLLRPPIHTGPDSSVYMQIHNMRQITLALHNYRKESEGKFPATLQILVDEGFLDDRTPLKTSHTKSGNAEPYIYLLGKTDTENPRAVLILAPPSARDGYRVVGPVGGSVSQMKMTDEEAEKLLSADIDRSR